MMRRWSGLILLLGAAVAFGGELSFREHCRTYKVVVTGPSGGAI